MRNIVTLKDVTVTYRGSTKPAIKNINFEVKEGEIIALVGRTGSGKSTLLQTLNKLVPEHIPAMVEGQIIVDGLNIKEHSSRELARHITYIFENPVTQIVGLTVEEDLSFGPINLGLPPDEIKKRITFATEAVRLQGFEKRNPRDLSGGEQQALAIGSALAMMPKILAMDEPICMLDPIGKARIGSIIENVNKEYGTTIILSEGGAEIEYVSGIAHRLVIMHNGVIVATGTPSEVFSQKDIKNAATLPQVTELALKLGWDGPIPVTVEKGYEYLSKYLSTKEKGERAPLEEHPAKEPIIKVRNLHHTYQPNIKALRGVNLDIYKGEFVAIIGQNGSGKTTLASHLVGLLKPTNPDAQVIIQGVDVTNKTTPIEDVIKHINYAFQNPDDQFFSERVIEELTFGPKAIGMQPDEIERRVIEASKLFGIEEIKNFYIVNLTRGQKERLAEASIVAMNPEVLIIDEPGTGLDGQEMLGIYESLKKLNEEGKTIIVITHEMKCVAKYARRVIVMKEGKILVDGPVREVFSKPEVLKEAWIAPPQIVQLAQRAKGFGIPPDVLTVDEMYILLKELIRPKEV